jgi:hypothetical protein
VVKAKLRLECPCCHWIFEFAPPDKIHFTYIFEKPLRRNYYAEVVEQFFCRNPECRKHLRFSCMHRLAVLAEFKQLRFRFLILTCAVGSTVFL